MRIDKHRVITSCYNIPGWCYTSELDFIYEIAKQSSRHLEIGAFCGKSLFAAACAMKPNSEIIVVDPLDFQILTTVDPSFNIPYDTWIEDILMLTFKAIKTHRPDMQIELIKTSSIDASRQVAKRDDPPFDTIYIDGDHTHEGVMTDIHSWLPLLRDGGVMCGHDYWPNHSGVMDAVDEAFREDFQVQSGTRIWYHSKS